ncbi:putative SERF-like protein isoform 2-T2 [Cochliomyia hominivorax]
MTRGNQRDLARQKNAKKQAELNKGKRNDNLTVEQRKQRFNTVDQNHIRLRELKMFQFVSTML